MSTLRSFTTAALLLAAAVALAGCDGDTTPVQSEGLTRMKDALPAAEEMALRVPESKALVGEQSELYRFTREITLGVNLFVRAITNQVEDVVSLPPSSTDDEDFAVWGPFRDALSPAVWQVRVQRVAEGSYEYRVEGWLKAQTAADALVVLEGSHRDGAAPGEGTGSWTYHIGNGHALDPIAHKGIGDVAVDYDLQGARQLEVRFTDVQGPADPLPTSTLYRYREEADGSGSFDFIANLDLDHGAVPERARRELAQVRSRWTPDGPGRADVLASHGDLPLGMAARVSECWDDAFAAVYTVMDLGVERPAEGDEAACAFVEREEPAFEDFDPDTFADQDLIQAVPKPGDFSASAAAVTEPVEDPALYYRFTQEIVAGIQTHLVPVLSQLEATTLYPPTRCDDAGCTWGPWTDWEAGTASALTIDRAGVEGEMAFRWEVRRADEPAGSERSFLHGGFLPAEEGGESRGWFVFELGLLGELGLDDTAAGTYVAELRKVDGVLTVAVRSEGMAPESGDGPTNARYQVQVAEDGSGSLVMGWTFDVDEGNPERALAEDVVILTRWQPDGAGVATGVVRAGDLGDEHLALVAQCWDERAAESHLDYLIESVEAERRLELDGDACVFSDWVEPMLPEMTH